MKRCAVCRLRINALCALLLAGCAPPPPQPAQPAGVKISGIATIRADGRPARRARLSWERTDGRDIVEIKTPLGTTQTQIVMERDEIIFFSGGREIPLRETGGEMQNWLLILPPPQSLGYWLLGAPDPNYSARETFIPDKIGAARIFQHGWEIEYAERGEDGRPARIELRATAEDAAGAPQNARATLEILQWFAVP